MTRVTVIRLDFELGTSGSRTAEGRPRGCYLTELLVVSIVLQVIVVLLRDLLKVWTCFGVTLTKKPGSEGLQRELTTMSAAYAAVRPSPSQSNLILRRGACA